MEQTVPGVVGEIPMMYQGEPTEFIQLGKGWHYLEQTDSELFRWTEPEFEVSIGTVAECLVLDYARACAR